MGVWRRQSFVPQLLSPIPRQKIGPLTVASTTDDPRIQKIKSSTVYGLYHFDTLLYVGETPRPLSVRHIEHVSRARRGDSAPIYEYVREHVEEPREDIKIRELSYDSEQVALDTLGDAILNVQSAEDVTYDGHPWTPLEVDRMEEILKEGGHLTDVATDLGIKYKQVRHAAIKLGTHDEDRDYTHVDWGKWDEKLGTMTDKELADRIGCSRWTVKGRRHDLGIEPCRPKRLSGREVREVWQKYALFDDLKYSDLADEYRVGRSTVGKIIREDTHADVDKPSPDEMWTGSWFDENDCVRTGPSQPIVRAKARG